MTLAPLLRRINAEPDAAMLLAALGLTERTVAPRVVTPNCARPSRARYVAGKCSCDGCRACHARYMCAWRLRGPRRVLRIVTNATRVVVVKVPQPLRADSRRRACPEQVSLEVS